MAAAWAVLHHLGDDGYLRLARQARTATEQLADAVARHPALELWAPPDAMLLSFGARRPDELDIYAVADALWRRGWYVDRQGPPPSIHCTVNAVHHGRIDAFVADLEASIDEVVDRGASGAAGAYGTTE